jgi:hypothetical protein
MRTPNICNGVSEGGARSHITGKKKREYTRTLETGINEYQRKWKNVQKG